MLRPAAAGPWPALRFLWRRSSANGLRAMARRVRQPRYAAGLLAGIAYFAWMGWIVLSPTEDAPDARKTAAFLAFAAPPLLATLAAGWWMSGRTHMALAFGPAEVQFLFQAPIARRTLLHFKLAKAQFTLLPMAVMLSAVFSALSAVPWALTVVSVWALLTVGHLHQLVSGLLRASWTHQGRAALRRQGWPLALLTLAGAAMLWALWPLAGAFRAAQEPIQVLWALEAALAHPAAALVLLPFHVAVGPLVAADVVGWGVGMAGLLSLGGLHYMWLVRIDAAFEELAAEAGVELQAIQTAFKEGRLGALQTGRHEATGRPWFRLGPTGHPAVAVFWKNFTAFTRTLSIVQALAIAATFLGFWTILLFAAESPEAAALRAAGLPGMLMPLALVMGPLLLRNDLRTDFQRLESMRTWPVSARSLVAAEVAGSGVSLLFVELFFLAPAFIFLRMGGPDLPAAWWLWAALGGVLVLLPPLCLLAAGIQNILVVIFPGWMELGPAQGQGLDRMGGMMVMMLVTSLLLSAGLLVPVVFGGVVAARLYAVLGQAALWPGFAAVWAVLAGEVVLLVTLLGEAYAEMDPSAEDLLR